MTIEKKLKEMLVQNGMFDDWADTVIARLKEDEVGSAMRGRWGDNVEDYPITLLTGLWISTKRIALEWLNENHPHVWFKSMFEG